MIKKLALKFCKRKIAAMTTKQETGAWLELNALQERLGHEFKDPSLLVTALTHTSWANEQEEPYQHNQRLEFLGDAVLELCVSSELYSRFPDAREGALTDMRGRLVCEPALAALACKLGLDNALRLGKGEERQEGRKKASLLSDVFEAVLGAVYLDAGFNAAREMVARIYADLWPRKIKKPKEKDPKSLLQEACQKMYKQTPIYILVGSSGPEHARIFDVRVTLPDGREFLGRETSAKKAEQVAAANALQDL